jgi:LuxR family maltose regulon positive regulatory protein
MSGEQSTTEQLLQAKLHRPRIPGRFVQRHRLLEKLDEGMQRQLSLISAPAGYGKTTLVNQWLDSVEEPYVWLSLDEHDNGLVAFSTYLAAAVRSRYPSTLPDTWAIVNTRPLPDPPRLADLFLHELEGLPGPLLLVLDDYHTIQDLAVTRFMTRLVQWLPAHVRLVLISRSDPPLALSHLRARRQMIEIRSADLSFRYNEVAEFLTNHVQEPINEYITTLLLERTEGWPVGLQLAALSLSNSEDAEGFARRFAGSTHRLISDYLIDEVLEKLDEQERIELLRISLLDQFCAPLCETLAGPDAPEDFGREFIQLLWRANLFVIALDDEGIWYRYHHLFRDLLRNRLGQLSSEKAIAELHGRAAAWYEKEGMIRLAISHFVAADALDAAVKLLERSFLQVLDQDDWHRLERWLSALPARALEFPSVQVFQAYIAHFRFHHEESLRLLDAAEEGFKDIQNGVDEEKLQIYAGIINTIRATALDVRGTPERSLLHAEKALQQLPQSLTAPYSLAEFHYYDAKRRLGEGKHALQLAQQALQSRPLGKPDARTLRLLMAIGNYYHAQADISNTLVTGETLSDLAQKANNTIAFGWGVYGLGWARYEKNELEAAQDTLKQVLERRFYVHGRSVIECSAGLVFTYLAQGKREAAEDVLQQLREFLLDRGFGGQLVFVDVLAMCVSLNTDNDALSRSEVNALADAVSQMTVTDLWFAPQLTIVRAYLRLGQPGDLQAAWDQLQDYGAKVKSIFNLRKFIQVKAFEALLCAARGDQEAALAALQEAVLLGEPGGALRTIADAGTAIVPLLQRLYTSRIAADYVARLLALLDAEQASSITKPAAQAERLLLGYDSALKASLTNRELDVLLLIARRLTNKEIAAELMLSPHTVKRHSLNLYRKLGVRNRREAVARAKVLDLLSS